MTPTCGRRLETKAQFIAQVMTGESDLRRIEDMDGAALTYAEVKAIASGNPMVIEKAGIDAEVARLSRLRCEYRKSILQPRTAEELRRKVATAPRHCNRQDTSGDKLYGRKARKSRPGIAGSVLRRGNACVALAPSD